MPRPFLVRVENARLTFPRAAAPVLDGLNFTLRPGRHTAIFGPNGAGKSTLLRLLRGEAWLDDGAGHAGGRILWNAGQGPESSPLTGRHMAAMVSAAQQEQYLRQGWSLSGEDLLCTAFADSPLLYAAPAAAQREAARAMARRMHAQALLERPVRALSQGQLRILLLGRALLRRPMLLLLDEYTDGLDAPTRRQLMALLEEAASDSTLVMTAHRADTIPAFVRRRLYVRNGRLTPAFPAPQVAACRGGGESLARKASGTEGAAIPGATGGACGLLSGAMRISGAAMSGATALSGLVRPVASGVVAAQPAVHAPSAAGSSPFVAADSPPLVELRNVTVYVEREPVLHNITWAARQGEHWMIHGGNGAGKSTLLRLLAGDEYPAHGGSIRRFLPRHGGAVADLESIRRGVRLVSDMAQATYAYDVTGLELVLTGCDNSVGVYRAAHPAEEQEALRWMDLLRVRALTGRRIRSLSTGQLRRLLLARALMGGPDMLLLDEPCSGLDVQTRHQVLDILQELSAGHTHLVLVSHHAEDRMAAINREARMEAGRLLV